MTEQAPASPEELDAIEQRIDGWFVTQAAANPTIDAVDRGEAGQRRWYVRIRGEEKDVWTIWFTLGQRTLRFETYLMPAPEGDEARFYEHLLRRNRGLTGMALEIGDEGAIFLAGSVPVEHLDEPVVDRILGSMYAYVELIFRPALRIGFAGRVDVANPSTGVHRKSGPRA
jgi:hypothetical protein